MLDTEISQVIAQMRAMQSAIDVNPIRSTDVADPGGFADAMKAAVDTVNQRQAAAAELVSQFQSGTETTSVAEVMVSMQKASVSFQAAAEVRNRLVEAYREIMNMPV